MLALVCIVLIHVLTFSVVKSKKIWTQLVNYCMSQIIKILISKITYFQNLKIKLKKKTFLPWTTFLFFLPVACILTSC